MYLIRLTSWALSVLYACLVVQRKNHELCIKVKIPRLWFIQPVGCKPSCRTSFVHSCRSWEMTTADGNVNLKYSFGFKSKLMKKHLFFDTSRSSRTSQCPLISPACQCVGVGVLNGLLYNMLIQGRGIKVSGGWRKREGIACGECRVCVLQGSRGHRERERV